MHLVSGYYDIFCRTMSFVYVMDAFQQMKPKHHKCENFKQMFNAAVICRRQNDKMHY